MAKAKAEITLYQNIDITAVYRYYLLQSSTSAVPSKPTTNPPSASWKLVEPSYTEGSTNSLYTVECTEFSNGSFSYSDVSLSSSYEAAKLAYNKSVAAQNTANSASDKINNLQIGGRNLLRMTANPSNSYFYTPGTLVEDVTFNGCSVKSTNTAWGGIRFYFHRHIEDRGLVEAGDTFTYSIWGKKSENETKEIKACITASGTLDGVSSNFIPTSAVSDAYITTEWKRFYYTFTVPAERLTDQNGSITGLRIEQNVASSDGCCVMWACPKLEKGNKPTDWSPAPEDTIIYADNTINDAMNNLQIGGRNLVLESGVEVTNSNYAIKTYYMSEYLIPGETYTTTICVTPAENVTRMAPYVSGGYTALSSLSVTGTSKQVVSKTFVMPEYYTGKTPEDNPTYGNVTIYRLPQNGVTGETTIHWVKIEKGDKSTDWTPAPEDVDADIEAVITETNVKTSNLETKTDGIIAEVSNVKTIQETTTNSIGVINTDITTLKESVESKMDSKSVNIAINTALQNGVTKVNTTTGFRFDEEGLTISKTGREMTTKIDEDGMVIKRNEEERLIANNEGVIAYDLHAKTYLIVGSNSRFEDYEKVENKLLNNGEWIATSSSNDFTWGEMGVIVSVKKGENYTLRAYKNDVLLTDSGYGYAYAYAYKSDDTQIDSTDYMSTVDGVCTKIIDNDEIAYLKIYLGPRNYETGDIYKVKFEKKSKQTGCFWIEDTEVSS